VHLVELENLITDKHVEGAGFPCSGPGFDSLHLHQKLFKNYQKPVQIAEWAFLCVRDNQNIQIFPKVIGVIRGVFSSGKKDALKLT
jgi:hypothetical protein